MQENLDRLNKQELLLAPRFYRGRRLLFINTVPGDREERTALYTKPNDLICGTKPA